MKQKIGIRDFEGWNMEETRDGIIMRVIKSDKPRVYFPMAVVMPKVTADELKKKKGLAKVWRFTLKRGSPYIPYWTGFFGKNHYKDYMNKHPSNVIGTASYFDVLFKRMGLEKAMPSYWKHQYELAKKGK